MALLLTALFFFARQSTRMSRSKNPSWRKRQDLARLSTSELRAAHENLTNALMIFKRSVAIDPVEIPTQIELLNNEMEEISAEAFADVVITSPPYLTRLDYGVSTGLEWRLLKGDRAADLTNWRASFTGSVLTSRTPSSVYPLPRTVGDVLTAIQRHPSKAAATYYFQFFRNYFVGIQNAIGNITKASKNGASGLFVVQDSQFKDINVPLTELFEEMLKAQGWSITKTEAFSILPTFYKINTKRWSAENFVRSENLISARRVE
jgi:hypothetical protein